MYVSTKVAGAIAVTAAEGGIGYWSQIDTYKPSTWHTGDWEDISQSVETKKVARNFVFYNIRVMNDNEDGYDEPPYAIDTELIQRGVDLYTNGIDGDPILYGDGDPESIRGRVNFQPRPFSDDLDCIDAAEADVVIQLGLFGKLVFG